MLKMWVVTNINIELYFQDSRLKTKNKEKKLLTTNRRGESKQQQSNIFKRINYISYISNKQLEIDI